VRRFKPGDEVYSRLPKDGIGAFAEYVAVREDAVAHKPKTLTMEEAASIPLVGLTSWQALVERANLSKGQRTLIHAGSGGVGTFAIQLAKHLGATKLAVPSAGNAGGALAAYAARAGLEAHIFMPRDTPRANIIECRELGAHVDLINGLITDCGAEIARRKDAEGWFDMSTLKEPYRIEGKKTLGYELAEQLNWQLPDVILYPTGGGTGLIGMWKAFDEMETLGWIDQKRPRMFSVQASGCAPIVRAFEAGEKTAAEFPDAHTIASGLRVPKAIGDFIMLKILRQSNGGAIAVDDEEMVRVAREVGSNEGLFVAPEGAACFAALKSLCAAGKIDSSERVVIFNTGSGIKYLDCYE